MPQVAFDELPGDARVWIFPAARPLGPAEQDRLLTEVDRFIAQWGAHDAPLTAGRELRYGRFLFVAVDQRWVGPSGCSIDALVRELQRMEQELDVALIDHAPVVWRAEDGIRRAPRGEFAALASSGAVGPQTTVFDNTLTRLGDVRAGRWETPAADSWHARAFFQVE